MLAQKVVGEGKLSFHLVVGRPREADAAALGQALQAGGDVDAITVEPRALQDHVAEIDPDAEVHPAGHWQACVPQTQLALDLGGTLDGVHHARELRQHVVAGGVHHTPVVPEHCRGDRLAVLGDRAYGGRFVVAHETAVAFHIGAQDRGQLAGHGTSLYHSKFYPPIDERADAPDEANTAVVTIGRAESPRDVTDRPPAEDGGEDDQAIDEQGAPSVDVREIRQLALAPSR
jgi:hypothetical protein